MLFDARTYAALSRLDIRTMLPDFRCAYASSRLCHRTRRSSEKRSAGDKRTDKRKPFHRSSSLPYNECQKGTQLFNLAL